MKINIFERLRKINPVKQSISLKRRCLYEFHRIDIPKNLANYQAKFVMDFFYDKIKCYLQATLLKQDTVTSVFPRMFVKFCMSGLFHNTSKQLNAIAFCDSESGNLTNF